MYCTVVGYPVPALTKNGKVFGKGSHSVKSEVKKNHTKSEVSQMCVTHL